MIICISEVLVFTNRLLCRESFLSRIEKTAKEKPKAIVLREKDLNEEDYKELAKKVIEICRRYGTQCILHSYVNTAAMLNHDALHLPFHKLLRLSDSQKSRFKLLGASVHSADEAVQAEFLGCTYITAGHIFDTDCKAGCPGKGLRYLREICESVEIPVYAIGGIKAENIADVIDAGAKGVCVMSGAMTCADVKKYLSSL